MIAPSAGFEVGISHSDIRVGGIVVGFDPEQDPLTEDAQQLLIVRHDVPYALPHSFPKGKLQVAGEIGHEDLLDGACRTVHEETGIHRSILLPLNDAPFTYRRASRNPEFDTKLVVLFPFLAPHVSLVPASSQNSTKPHTTDAFWMTREGARGMLPYQEQRDLIDDSKFAVVIERAVRVEQFRRRMQE